jgi:hypothetical protein
MEMNHEKNDHGPKRPVSKLLFEFRQPGSSIVPCCSKNRYQHLRHAPTGDLLETARSGLDNQPRTSSAMGVFFGDHKKTARELLKAY